MAKMYQTAGSRPINARLGEPYVVELNWQQHLSFLPGVRGGRGVLANYTYNKGSATFDGTYGGRSGFALPGQFTHMWNASVFYNRGLVNVRVAYIELRLSGRNQSRQPRAEPLSGGSRPA